MKCPPIAEPGDHGNRPIGARGLGRISGAGLAIGDTFMFEDDQQTPNTLNAAYIFETPGGKRKMMEIEAVPDHNTKPKSNGAYGASSVPPAVLPRRRRKKPAEKKSVRGLSKPLPWDRETQRRTRVGNLFYGSRDARHDGYDAYKTGSPTKWSRPAPGRPAAIRCQLVDCVRRATPARFIRRSRKRHVNHAGAHRQRFDRLAAR